MNKIEILGNDLFIAYQDDLKERLNLHLIEFNKLIISPSVDPSHITRIHMQRSAIHELQAIIQTPYNYVNEKLNDEEKEKQRNYGRKMALKHIKDFLPRLLKTLTVGGEEKKE